MHAIPNRIHLLYPDQRSVDIEQIQRWASDDLYNEEGRVVADWRKLDPAMALAIVQHHGSVTIRRIPGVDLPEYKTGDEIDGVAVDEGRLDFAMLDLPTRPGPAKAAAAPEQDPVERRIERARDSAEHIAAAAEAKALGRGALPCNALSVRNQVRQHEMSKALGANACCPDCGHETGHPGLCMSCDWHASHRTIETAPEQDPAEHRLEREVEVIHYTYTYRKSNGETGIANAVEVKHGSGKVRV